jgi:AcrR family transcriptional regulator
MLIEAHTDEAESQVADGRTARRERGRLLVIDSVIDLVFEGNAPPTAEQVAARANVSMSTLFRYFETFDDLRNQAASRFFERYADRYEVPDLGRGSFDDRIDNFVTSRLELHELNHPMSRLIRQKAPEVAGTHQRLDRLRGELARQVGEHFNAELASTTPAIREDVVAVVATLTSFEAWDQLRNHHDRSPAQIRRAWKSTLAAILSVNPPA